MNNTIFTAFEGGYFGPSYYYFITKNEEVYEFRYGYSEYGMLIDNDEKNPNLHIMKQNEEYYRKFIKEIIEYTKNWNDSYVNNKILDGTQWNIEISDNNKKYSGSNDFPRNYRKVKKLLKKYFNVKK